MQSVSVFIDVTKFAEFPCKNADVSRNHVIHIFFEFFLGQV